MSRERVVSLAHFTMNNMGSGALAGVERVMATQRDILQRFGVEVRLVVGATDAENPHQRNIIVVPELRSDPAWGWHNGDVVIDEAQISLVFKKLLDTLGNSGVVFHNTTNASKHNVHFGVAAARYVSEHPNSVMWIHDLRGSNARQIRELLPDRQLSRLVCVSQARRQKVEEVFRQMTREARISLPEYELLVIPNPIDEQFFADSIKIPSDLASIAPNYEQFSQEYELMYQPELAYRMIFDDSYDVIRLLVPARIVPNKGIHHAIGTAREYARLTGQRTTLILSGPPDLRKTESQQYWRNTLLPLLREIHPNVHIIPLGGVAWEYMPFLYRQSHAVLAPFENEGFCMPLIEAGLMGTPSVINVDEAMKETTDGYALVIPLNEWGTEASVKAICSYLASQKVSFDIVALQEKARSQLHPGRVAEQILRAVNL